MGFMGSGGTFDLHRGLEFWLGRHGDADVGSGMEANPEHGRKAETPPPLLVTDLQPLTMSLRLSNKQL